MDWLSFYYLAIVNIIKYYNNKYYNIYCKYYTLGYMYLLN